MRYLRLAPIAWVLFPGLFLASYAFAAEETRKAALDVVLVLDNSGSMKQNDPKTLLREVVSSFAEHLNRGSRLGIISFDDVAELLLPLSEAGNESFVADVNQSLSRIDYGGQFTDFPVAIERAIYELRQHGRPKADRIIVLLTDGIVDTGDSSRDKEKSRWLREDLAREASQLGISFFGVAFTEAADFALLQSVAQVTKGEYYRVLVASEITSTFERIRAKIETARKSSDQPIDSSPVVTTVVPLIPWWALVCLLLLLGLLVLLVARRSSRKAPSVQVPAAKLRDLSGQSSAQTHRISKPLTRIGRDESSDVVLPDGKVSMNHAEIEFRQGSFILRDKLSTNGTWLRGKKLGDKDEREEKEAILRNGDRMRFDSFEFEFVRESQGNVKETRLAGDPSSVGATVLRPEGIGTPESNRSAQLSPAEQERETRLKPERCPYHPEREATDLCESCSQGFCGDCVQVLSGRTVCHRCARPHLT